MKNTLRTLALFFALFAGLHLRADDPITPYQGVVSGYTLAWSDEFNGDKVDESKWQYRIDSKHWSTQLPANVSEAGGKLVIALKREPSKGKAYTGGGVISKDDFQYGYYESSFKVPPGSGWHTSFWAQAYNGADTKPVGSQELDICEQDSNNVHHYSAGVFNWGDKGQNTGRKQIKPEDDLSAGFHVWACEYTPQEVKFFFDGKLTHTVDVSKMKQAPQKIWLTCIASPLTGTTFVDRTKLPATAEFDYVRYFKKAGE